MGEKEQINLGGIVTRDWTLSFIALASILVTTSLMNVAVFPYLDTVTTSAREVSTFANLLACIVIGFVSFFRPRFLATRWGSGLACVFMLVSAAVIPSAKVLDSIPLLLLGMVLSGAARAWIILEVGMACARLSRVQAGTCVTCSLFVSYILALAAWVMPTSVCLTLFSALPVVALLVSVRQARPMFEAASRAEKPLDLVITQPNTFLPLGSQVFICLLLFRVAFGFSLRFGETGGVPLMDFWAILVIAAIGLYMLFADKAFPADGLVMLATLLVIAGFYVSATVPGTFYRVGTTLLSAGSVAFDLVSWLVLLAVARRNRYGAVASFTWGHALMCAGSILGAQAAVAANMFVLDNQLAFSLLNGVFVVGFAAWGLFGLRKYSFAEVIYAVVPAVTYPEANAADGVRSDGEGLDGVRNEGDGENSVVAFEAGGARAKAAAAVGAGSVAAFDAEGASAAGGTDFSRASVRGNARVGAIAPVAAERADDRAPGGESPTDEELLGAGQHDRITPTTRIRSSDEELLGSGQHDRAPRTLEERCKAIGNRYSLTNREREVLGLLARGRDRAYIERELVVSRNTVKAHVKHIYAKLDIHSHQELLDLVDSFDK